MVLRTEHGLPLGEDAADLADWLGRLEGPHPVTGTVVLACSRHGEDRPTWCYVDADAAAGVARRRCLACATPVWLLDSEARWTFPTGWSCSGCRGTIAEVAAGVSAPDGEQAQWVVVAARCVHCGRIAGLTDIVVDGRSLTQVLAAL